MIAAGLCLMGGCFAQDSQTVTVDTYWMTDWVDMPTYSSTVGIYQYEGIQGPSNVEGTFMETVQYVEDGLVSFFYILQGQNDSYANVFIHSFDSTPRRFRLRMQSLTQNSKDFAYEYPSQIKVFMKDGFLNCTDGNTTGAFEIDGVFDYSQKITRMRIADARNGQKRYRYSYGNFSVKWFVHAMRSITSSSALFDFEGKVLVEL